MESTHGVLSSASFSNPNEHRDARPNHDITKGDLYAYHSQVGPVSSDGTSAISSDSRKPNETTMVNAPPASTHLDDEQRSLPRLSVPRPCSALWDRISNEALLCSRHCYRLTRSDGNSSRLSEHCFLYDDQMSLLHSHFYQKRISAITTKTIIRLQNCSHSSRDNST